MNRLPDTVRAARRVADLQERLTTARIERDRAIVARWHEGVTSVSVLGAEAGITKSAVYNVLHSAGIRSRHRGLVATP